MAFYEDVRQIEFREVPMFINTHCLSMHNLALSASCLLHALFWQMNTSNMDRQKCKKERQYQRLNTLLKKTCTTFLYVMTGQKI